MSQLTVYGAEWCGDCRRSKSLLDRLGVPYEYVDIENDDQARDVAVGIAGSQTIPVVVFPDGSHAVEPSDPWMRGKLAELSLIDA